MRKTFTLTITLDEDIATKYPNYRFNYSSPEEFIDGIVYDICTMPLDGDGLHTFGYRINVEEN